MKLSEDDSEDELLAWGLVITFLLGVVLLALGYFAGLNPGWAILDGVLFLLFLGGLMMGAEED